jgi:hypothetical protein
LLKAINEVTENLNIANFDSDVIKAANSRGFNTYEEFYQSVINPHTEVTQMIVESKEELPPKVGKIKFNDAYKKNIGITIAATSFFVNAIAFLYFTIDLAPKLINDNAIKLLLLIIGITISEAIISYGLIKYKKWARGLGLTTAFSTLFSLLISLIAIDVVGFLFILVIALIAANVLSIILLLANFQKYYDIYYEIYE